MSDVPTPNPFSTGGGGTNFEQKVASFYMAYLLLHNRPDFIMRKATDCSHF